MKILMITPGMTPSQNSGMGLAAGKIAQQLTKTHDLLVIEADRVNTLPEKGTSTWSSEKFSLQETIVDMVRTVTSSIDVYDTQIITQHDQKSKTVQYHLQQFTEQVIKESKGVSPDVIYAHDWVSFPAAIKLKKQLDIPLVLHVHSLDVERISSIHHSWIFELEREAIALADKVIVVSKHSAERLIEHYHANAAKIVIAYNGVSLPAPKTKAKKRFKGPLIVFAGRLAEQKGGSRFISIAEKVSKAFPKAHFALAGSGELENDLVELAAQKEIGHCVHFTGHLSQQQLWDLFEEADVFCLPSRDEPFGLVALEAAALEIPVVLSEQAGVSEVLPKAMTHDFRDVAGFADSISKILKNEVDVSFMKEANKIAASKLTWVRTGAKVSETLSACI